MYGFIERERPVVYVLTDGGGRSQQPRLPRTAAVVENLDAPKGSIFGRISDLALYDMILAGDVAPLISLVEELAEDLIARDVDCVLGDAAEGYSSAHDVWRLMIDAAIRLARSAGREIENYEFFLVSPPDDVPPGAEDRRDVLLNDGEFSRKMDAARAYSPKLAADVDAAMAGGKFFGIRRFSEPQIAGDADSRLTAALTRRFTEDARFGASISALLRGVDVDAFRREIYWRRDPHAPLYASTPPFYEVYGEELVRAGRYQRVIRYEDHLRPIGDALAGLTSARKFVTAR